MNPINPNGTSCDLSVIIPVIGSPGRLAELLPQVHKVLSAIPLTYEIIISTCHAEDAISQTAEKNGAILLFRSNEGYGAALMTGVEHAIGKFIIAMDTDQVQADFLFSLWDTRDSADIVIASRYVQGGKAGMPILRLILSRALNIVFSRGLDLQIRDMSSGFRLYKAHILKKVKPERLGYDILQEILVKTLMEGYHIREVPFEYHGNDSWAVFHRISSFGLDYLRTFTHLWRIRNSIASADYDARAYSAMMPPQRYWQRQRYKIIAGMLDRQKKCIDVGCGSSRIIGILPPGSVVADILLRKLRYARRYGHPRVQASLFNLPVDDESFPCVVCSQVIEHIPREGALSELDRILRPGGVLILGTPDYANWQWILIERLYKILLPQAYADEHITHYTRAELLQEMVEKRGYQILAVRYILQGELILSLQKPHKADE